MEEQLSEQFENGAPAKRRSTGSLLLIGLAPAIVVVALIVVGIFVFNKPVVPVSGSALSTKFAAGAGKSAGGDADQITRVMEQYVDAINTGNASKFKSLLCERVLVTAPDLEDAPPLEENRARLDDVSDVQVDGDTATALVTASEEGSPELGSKSTTLQFVNEDGWKVCQDS